MKTNTGGKEVFGNPTTEAESWKEHFSAIQNGEEQVHTRVWQNVAKHKKQEGWMSAVPTEKEITRCIRKMKFGKAPGIDGVTVEMIKWVPPEVLERIILVVQSMWTRTITAEDALEAEEWPAEWTTAIIIPLWKNKHPKRNKNNWRGITLLSVGTKIMARVFSQRTQTFSEQFMGEHQNGFRKNRGRWGGVKIG